MAFYDRLKESRIKAGLTQEQLAEKLGIAKSTLSGYESGNREPTVATIAKALELLNIDANYLYQDETKTLTELVVSLDEKELLKKYRSLDTPGREIVDFVLDREVSRSQRIAELEKRPAAVVEFHGRSDVPARAIKYFHSVSAGTGQVLFDDVYSEDVVIPDIPEYRRVAYAVKVSGRSMEPLYYDGDILLVEPACEIDVGEIGIFNVDGQAYVKKLGEHELISLNEEYNNIPLNEGSRCMGRVVDKFTM